MMPWCSVYQYLGHWNSLINCCIVILSTYRIIGNPLISRNTAFCISEKWVNTGKKEEKAICIFMHILYLLIDVKNSKFLFQETELRLLGTRAYKCPQIAEWMILYMYIHTKSLSMSPKINRKFESSWFWEKLETRSRILHKFVTKTSLLLRQKAQSKSAF